MHDPAALAEEFGNSPSLLSHWLWKDFTYLPTVAGQCTQSTVKC